eukprot:7360866-Pyramimonas_sp.AAC.1
MREEGEAQASSSADGRGPSVADTGLEGRADEGTPKARPRKSKGVGSNQVTPEPLGRRLTKGVAKAGAKAKSQAKKSKGPGRPCGGTQTKGGDAIDP